MITISSVDMTGFNRGLQGLSNLGIPMSKVVRKETGELIKTLVRISPPKDRQKSLRNVADEARHKFYAQMMQDNNFEGDPAKVSKTGVKWYLASRKFLFGATADKDMTEAGTEDLLRVHYSVKKVGHSRFFVTNFINPRRTQRVALATRFLATDKQIDRLVKRLQGKFGRLKASWLVATTKGIVITGGFQPPAWVRKHLNSKTRGKFVNHLNNPNNPHVIISSHAKGVTSERSLYWVNAAVKVRAKAMLANAREFFKRGKNLADYG